MAGFEHLKQEGGLSGYPNRSESQHDLVENSHASTALSYAYGMASALQHRRRGRPDQGRASGRGCRRRRRPHRRSCLRGAQQSRPLRCPRPDHLNDNGRSYAPTISKLSGSLTQLRLDPRYVQTARAHSARAARPAVRRRLGRVHLDPRAHVGAAGGRGAPRVLRGSRRALHRSARRPRHPCDGTGDAPGCGVARTNRPARAHEEGQGLRSCGGRRDPEAA